MVRSKKINDGTDFDTVRQRVIRLSRINAWSVVAIAGFFAIVSIGALSLVGVVVGAFITLSGFMEIRGHSRLRDQIPGARAWMAGSQLWLLMCVLGYCSWRLYSLDPSSPLSGLQGTESLLTLVEMMGYPPEMVTELFVRIYRLTYRLVALLTVLFQGGLGLFYWVRVGGLEKERPL